MCKLKRFAAIVTVFIVLFCISSIDALADNVSGTVTGSVVNVRNGPGIGYNIVAQVNKGSVVDVISEISGWYKINVNNTEGYIIGDYLSVEGQIANNSNNNLQGIVTGSVVNVRTGPGTGYGIISQVKKDASINIISTQYNGWYKISINNTEGYVCSDYVRLSNGNNSTDDLNREGMVTGSVVNVRTGPGTGYDIITQVVKGDTIVVTGQENEWYRININGKEAYISSYYVSVSRDDDKIQSGVITGSVVNFRKGPGTSYVSEALLIKGTIITVHGTEGEWVKVEYNGNIGYVYSAYVSIGSDGSASAVDGDKLIEYAESLLGIPYLYGGTTPLGFDCSGFTQYVYAHFGIITPRTATAQYSAYAKITKEQLKKGDLVFFSGHGSSSIKHVGIYAGGGWFIHSPSTGSYVKYSSLDSGYYDTYYYGAVRVSQ